MNKRKSKHLKGKIVTFVQLILSLIFIATVINNEVYHIVWDYLVNYVCFELWTSICKA